MSSNKSKRSQKMGSSRRSRHNRDAGVRGNDKQFERLESQDNELYTASETQPASDLPPVAGINEPTSTLELPALSQLQDCNDPSARANVASKKRKMGSTRKNNRREVQEPSEEELKRTLDVTGGVTEELEVTEDVSVKEKEIKEHYEQAGDAIIKKCDIKEETEAGPVEDFSVRIAQKYLHSDVMSTTRDMLSVTDHPQSNEWTIRGNEQQQTDVATNVVSTEGFEHETIDQEVASDLISQSQNAVASLDIHETITKNKEIEIKDETEWCEGTDTPFTILSTVHQTDERQTKELSTKLGSFPNEHDQSKEAQSGQNYYGHFSDPATECKEPPQVNNQLDIFCEQVKLSQHTLPNTTNKTPNEKQVVSQGVQKRLNDLVDSATPSKSKDNVLNSMPDQASSVVTEEDKQETESTHTLPSSGTDLKGVNEAATKPSISLLNENEKDEQCLNSGTPMAYSQKDAMSQEDSKNVITKASTDDKNISDHGGEHKEDHLQLKTDLPCVEVICAKENLNEVTEENKDLICSNQECVDEQVADTTYLKQTVQPDRNISETPKQKEQIQEGSLDPSEPTGSEVLHHNSKESSTEQHMIKTEEDLSKSVHDEAIKADVSESMRSEQLLDSSEISDFVRETVLIPAVSLYEEMQATDFVHDTGELPFEIKLQPNKEDSAPLEKGFLQLSDNELNPDTRITNEAPFHLNNTVDKDGEKESNVGDDRNPEIVEELKPQESLCDRSALSKGEQENTEAMAVMSNKVDQQRKLTMAVLETMNVNTENKEMLVDDVSHDLSDDKFVNTEGDAIKSADLHQTTEEGLPQKNKKTQSFEEGVIQEAYSEQDSKKADESLGDKENHDDRGYHGEAKDGNTSQTSKEQVVDCAEIIKAHYELADVLHEESFSQTGKNLVFSPSGLESDFPSNTLKESVIEDRLETENSVNVQDNEISNSLQASPTSEFVTTNTEALLTSVETMEAVEKDHLSEPNIRDDWMPDMTPLQEEANVLIGKSGLKRKMGSTRKTVRRKQNEDMDMFTGSKDNCEIAETKNEVKEEINTNPNESFTSDGFSTVATAQQYNSGLSSLTFELTVTNTDPSFVTEKVDPIEDNKKERRDTKLDNDEFGLQDNQQLWTAKEEKELEKVATVLLTKPEVSHAVSLTTKQKETVEPKDETGQCGRIYTSAVHQTDSVVWDEVTDAKVQAELKAGNERLEEDVDQESKFTSVTEKQNDTLTDHTSMSTQEHTVNTNNPSASQADHPSCNNLESGIWNNLETNASLVIPVNKENVDEPDQNGNTYGNYSENLTNRDQDSEQLKSLAGSSQGSKPTADDEMTHNSGKSNSGNRRKFGSTRSCGGQSAGYAKEVTLGMAMENENKQEETEKCTAESELETLSIVAETSIQSIERLSVESEQINIKQLEKIDNSGLHDKLTDEVHVKQTIESDTILTPKQINQEDRGEQNNHEAGQLKDEILSEKHQTKNEEYYKEDNFTSDINSVEAQATTWSILSDVSSLKTEDFEIQEQKNKDGDLSIKKESHDIQLSIKDLTQQFVHGDLSLQTTELSLISNMTPAHVTGPMDDTTEHMEKETVELHTQTETKKRKFGSKRKCQQRQQPNTKQEMKEWKDVKDKEVDDQTVDQEATPSLLSEPQMSLVICDPSLLNQEILESGKNHERIDTPPIMLSNVHQNYTVIPETKDTLFMPEYKTNSQIVGSEESEEGNLENLSKQNKITEQEQSLDVPLHESKSGDDNLITENPVNSGQRRKMGSTRKGLRGHALGAQKENIQEQAKKKDNTSCKNEGGESEAESRVTEESTELIKTAANETEQYERIETQHIMLSNVHQIENVAPETTETLLMAEYKDDDHVVGSEQIHEESEERNLENLSNKISENEKTESPDVHLYEIKSDDDSLITQNPVTSGQKRKMGSTRKGLRGHDVGDQKEGNTSCKNEDGGQNEADSRGAEDNITESIKKANGDTVDTVLQDAHCDLQITKTTSQDDKPQSHSNTSLLSEIVCELEMRNQPNVSPSAESTSEQYKGPLQVPASQSSGTPTPPSSPGKKRKMGSSRKISRNKAMEKINSESTDTNFQTENLDNYEVQCNSTVVDSLIEDVQGSVAPIAQVQAPGQTDEISTTTTEHQGKRKFGSRRTAKEGSGLGVHTLDDHEVDQKKTDIQRISEDLMASDPSCSSEPESTAISQILTEYGGTKSSLEVEEENLPAVKATGACLVSLHDITKTSPPDESTKEQTPKINFEQWNEPIPDFGLAVYNVVMVGDSNVGKTSFIRRIQSGNFSSNYSATIGVDTFVQTVTLGNRTVKLYIWDTAGQERYHSITRQVFHKAQGLLLMYDISSAQSFHAVRNWITQVQEKASPDVIIMLLGNKNDCSKREVEQKEGEDLSKEYNIHFMECSAATGHNVSESMKTLAWLLVKQRVRKEEDQTVLQPKPQQNKSGCC